MRTKIFSWGWIYRRNIAALAMIFALFSPSFAQAELMLYPTRVVIDEGKRSAQVEIINRGQEPETYRINIVNRRMSETGEIVAADTPAPDEQFADGMLRYTPRLVTLQPGVSQTVRISVRKPANLAPGEYRSHLQFDRVAEVSGAADIENATNQAKSGEVSIILHALIGASIPVIVRHGKTSATVRLDSLQLEPSKGTATPELSFVFRREGDRSVYGDVVVNYVAPGKKLVEVGKVSGIAVYAPNVLRRARLPLMLPDGIALRGGTLHLRYNERPEAGGALLGDASIAVP